MAALQPHLNLLPRCTAALLLQVPAILALYRAASSLSSLHHSALLPKDHLILPNTIPLLGLYMTFLLSMLAVLEPVILPLEGMSILCLVIINLCPFAMSPSHLSKTTLDSSALCFRQCPSSPCTVGTSAIGIPPHLSSTLSEPHFCMSMFKTPMAFLQQPYSSQTLCLRDQCHFSDFSAYFLETVVFPIATVPALWLIPFHFGGNIS